MLRTLAERGYIQRTVSAEDSRKNVLSATEKGLAASTHLTQDMYGFMKKLHGDIPKAVASMAIPTIVAMIVTMVYNIAGTFFIGQTGNALMVSAVSLTSPIFTAFGNLFGIGGSTAASFF